MTTDLRHVLRADTAHAHDRVDALISGFDVAAPDGFCDFLQLHLCCFRAMRGASSENHIAAKTLDQVIVAIRADLNSLDRMELLSNPALTNVDTLAIDYMFEGSRLGTKVLKRRWQTSPDPKVQSAGQYFGVESTPGRWREVCTQLSDVPSHSARAQNIIADTHRLFHLFETVAQKVQSQPIYQSEVLT